MVVTTSQDIQLAKNKTKNIIVDESMKPPCQQVRAVLLLLYRE